MSATQQKVFSKKIIEILDDIKIFCFNFAHILEYRHRDYSLSERTASIEDMIVRLSDLKRDFEMLEK